MIIDDASGLGKKLGCVLSGDTPGLLPIPMSLTEGKKIPEGTATVLGGTLDCVHLNFGPSFDEWFVSHKEKYLKDIMMLLAYYPDYCMKLCL